MPTDQERQPFFLKEKKKVKHKDNVYDRKYDKLCFNKLEV